MPVTTVDEALEPARRAYAAGDVQRAVLSLMAAMRTIAPRGMRPCVDTATARAQRDPRALAELDADGFEAMLEQVREAFEAHLRSVERRTLEQMAGAVVGIVGGDAQERSA